MLYDPKNDYDDIGKTLLKTADYLEEHGHCKGSFSDLQGRVCLYGALNIVIYGISNRHNMSVGRFNSLKTETVLWYSCSEAIVEAHIKLTRDIEGSVVDWNDAVDRTPDQVIDLVRFAAEKHKVIA